MVRNFSKYIYDTNRKCYEIAMWESLLKAKVQPSIDDEPPVLRVSQVIQIILIDYQLALVKYHPNVVWLSHV